jgi:hypothetical protein
MDTKNLPLEYANNFIYDLAKAFWDERGAGARYRTAKVGEEFYKQYCHNKIKGKDPAVIIQTISDVLKGHGIIADVSLEQDDRLLRIKFEGCLHRPIEDKVKALGTEPFTCLPANLIMMAIDEILNRPTEVAEIRCEGNVCNLIIIIFDERPATL